MLFASLRTLKVAIGRSATSAAQVALDWSRPALPEFVRRCWRKVVREASNTMMAGQMHNHNQNQIRSRPRHNLQGMDEMYHCQRRGNVGSGGLASLTIGDIERYRFTCDLLLKRLILFILAFLALA